MEQKKKIIGITGGVKLGKRAVWRGVSKEIFAEDVWQIWPPDLMGRKRGD